MNNTYESLNQAYEALAEEIYTAPDYISSPRGSETKEKIAVSLTITNPYDRVIVNPARKFSLKYGIAEWLWYDRNSNSLDEIAHYSKFWRNVSDDGKTVNSAYGYRIHGKGAAMLVDQWLYARNELIKDKDSRRAVCIIASPSDMINETKDFPCTMYLQFLIRENKLHLAVSMRSNDLVLGFGNDVFAFTLMQEKMLNELQSAYPELTMGHYHHFAGSLHIYQNKYSLIEDTITQKGSTEQFPMPRMKDLNEIEVLQRNEDRIRNGNTSLENLEDAFCVFSQKWLAD